VYNLCLGSKIFFRQVSVETVASRDEAKKSKSEVTPVPAATTSPTIEHLLSCGFSLPYLSDQTEDKLKDLLSKHPIAGDDRKSSSAAAKSASLKSDSPKLGDSSSVLATSLLRSSLLSSLERVLKQSQSGITLQSAISMGELLPDGSAIIAGSTIVQTCLGRVWKGSYGSPPDVDIFCSAKAAPQVRSVSRVHSNRCLAPASSESVCTDNSFVSRTHY
jgi:hypothetical protein